MHKEDPLLSLQNYNDDKKNSHSIAFVGLVCTLLLGFLYLLSPTLLDHFDYRIYDIFLKSCPANNSSSKPVIVDLDEQSLREYGQWPWPRYLVADLFNKVNSYQPASITLDIIFSEPDRTSIGPLLRSFSKEFDVETGLTDIPESLLDNDEILSHAIAKGPYILATKFHLGDSLEKSANCILYPLQTFYFQDTGQKVEISSISSAKSILCNISVLTAAVNSAGFTNIAPDRDGILRRAPLLLQYQGRIFPSLALATMMKYAGSNQLRINVSGGQIENIQFAEYSIPVDPKAQALIKFRGPGGNYDYISADDIIKNNIAPERLKDKIVFIGTSATGLMDFKTTPFDHLFPGVEVNATIVDNILTGDFLKLTPWVSFFVFSLVLVLGTISSLILSRSASIWGFFFTCLSIVTLWFGAQWLFINRNFFFPLSHLMVSIALLYLVLTVFKFRMEEKKVFDRTKELLLTQDATIESMATLAEYRDPDTGGHIKRTREYIRLLAEYLQHKDKFKDHLTDSVIAMLYKSAPLHDIGKVGVPDNILLKTGSLTQDEFDIMKKHTLMGRDVIKAAESNLGKDSFLKFAGEMAYTHQEKWDGSGYPQGLKGEDIPLSGRIMALADVYDALISRRPYKKPFSHLEAINTIKLSSGNHFDPDIVDAFVDLQDEFREIALEYADFDDEREMLAM